ncbi:hypothetical protein DFQ30_000468, partial [Apophysomyces sp. BC1015]
MSEIAEYLHQRECETRYFRNSERCVQGLFFCHPISIVDATYKTNVYKMPYVNIVGIGIVGIRSPKTFAISGAWIADETKITYEWVFRQLNPVVYQPASIAPTTIATDNAAAELGAAATAFPKQMLSTIKNSPPSLTELKEPEQIVQKGRPKSAKRKLTAAEILDKKVAEEKKKQAKQQKLSQNISSEKVAVPRIRLIVKDPSVKLEE